MGTLARRRALLEQLPSIPCTGACATVACRDLGVSDLDIVAMSLAGATLGAADDGRTCSALVDGRCAAHDERPFICRVYGVSPELPCPYGCQPEAWVDTMSLVRLHMAIEDLDPRAARFTYIGHREDHAATQRRAIGMMARHMEDS